MENFKSLNSHRTCFVFRELMLGVLVLLACPSHSSIVIKEKHI